MNRNIRIISRLDIKTNHVVKGIQLEGLRKLGAPQDFAKAYYEDGIDEIVYIDIVASLYERNSLLPILRSACTDIFIPLTVTGGIRSVENVSEALQSGADKVGINTAAIKSPSLISEIASRFGSQCVVASIEAKRVAASRWEAYYDSGREKTALDVVEWAREAARLGAGEILLTSVDQEGTEKGFDLDLLSRVCDVVTIPVIASGGAGTLAHIREAVSETRISGIALGKVLHSKKLTVAEIKSHLASLQGIEIR